MRMRKLNTSLILSFVLTALCLLIGSPQQLKSAFVFILILLIPIGLLTRKQDPFWISCLMLCSYLVMVILSFQQNGDRFILIIGAVFSLASWDMFLFRKTLKGNLYLISVDRLIIGHLKSLAVALAISILTSMLALTFPLRLPFASVFLLSLLILICFFQLLVYLWKKKPE